MTEREQIIDRLMRERYDLKALRAFLGKAIDHQRAVDGIYFFSVALDSEWVIERVEPPNRMRCGGWVLWDANQGDDEFDFYTFCSIDHSSVVNLRCRRRDRKRFEVISIAVEPFASLKG